MRWSHTRRSLWPLFVAEIAHCWEKWAERKRAPRFRPPGWALFLSCFALSLLPAQQYQHSLFTVLLFWKCSSWHTCLNTVKSSWFVHGTCMLSHMEASGRVYVATLITGKGNRHRSQREQSQKPRTAPACEQTLSSVLAPQDSGSPPDRWLRG